MPYAWWTAYRIASTETKPMGQPEFSKTVGPKSFLFPPFQLMAAPYSSTSLRVIRFRKNIHRDPFPDTCSGAFGEWGYWREKSAPTGAAGCALASLL